MSPELAIWQNCLPNFIPPDSGKNHRGRVKTSAHTASQRSTTPTSTTTTMPCNTRGTRSQNHQPPAAGTTNQRQTHKRGESDPNEHPKRPRTRNNNIESEVDEVEVDEAGVDQGAQKVNRPAGRAKRLQKKQGTSFSFNFSSFSFNLSVFFIFLFLFHLHPFYLLIVNCFLCI